VQTVDSSDFPEQSTLLPQELCTILCKTHLTHCIVMSLRFFLTRTPSWHYCVPRDEQAKEMRGFGLQREIHSGAGVAEILLAPVHESRVAAPETRKEGIRVRRRVQPDMAFAVAVVRQARSMSQAKLAKVTEMPRQWVTRIESGRYDPTIASVHKLAKGLKVSARTLVCISEARRAA